MGSLRRTARWALVLACAAPMVLAGAGAAQAADPAPLTITASSPSMTYGGTVPAITPVIDGLVNGDTPADLGTITCTTTATSSSDAGAYPSSCGGAVDSDYTITYVNGIVTVGKAFLDVTADDITRPVGTANPPLTYTLSGFVNGDDASVVTGAPILDTDATQSSPAGEYFISISGGTLAADNYIFALTAGVLTVEEPQKTLTIVGQNVSIVRSVLPGGMVFKAKVTDAGTGDPVAGVTVTFSAMPQPLRPVVCVATSTATGAVTCTYLGTNRYLFSLPTTYTMRTPETADHKAATATGRITLF